jgi:hypothetical protein
MIAKTSIYSAFCVLLLSCAGADVNRVEVGSPAGEPAEELISMEPREVGVEEYIASVINAEDNSLVREKTIGDFTFDVSYEPWEALIIKDHEKRPSREEMEKELNERSRLLYFTVKMNNTQFTQKELLLFDLPSEADYTERISYYSFKVQQDLKLKIGTEEIPCGMAHFERTFGLSPGLTLSVAFPVSDKTREEILAKKLKETLTLVFDEKIFNHGTLQFAFHPNAINAIPKPIIE